MPGEGIGQKAADGRTHGPGNIEQHRDDDHQCDQRRPAELRIDDRPHGRRDGTAAKPLHRAIEDHLAEASGGGAQRARTGEAECGDHEHDAGRQQPRHHRGRSGLRVGKRAVDVPPKVRFSIDSLLERSGFEPLVPP